MLQVTTEGMGERYEIEMEGLSSDKDHVHLLCGAHPKLAPGRIVQIYKSLTAREVDKRGAWGRGTLIGRLLRGNSGEIGDWATVEAYVREQGNP